MTNVVEHLLYADVFLPEPPFLVSLYHQGELLEVFGFYVLIEDQFIDGLVYRTGDIAFRQSLQQVGISAIVRFGGVDLFDYEYDDERYNFYGKVLTKNGYIRVATGKLRST